MLTLLPGPKSEIKQKWDNFLAEYEKDRDGKTKKVEIRYEEWVEY